MRRLLGSTSAWKKKCLLLVGGTSGVPRGPTRSIAWRQRLRRPSTACRAWFCKNIQTANAPAQRHRHPELLRHIRTHLLRMWIQGLSYIQHSITHCNFFCKKHGNPLDTKHAFVLRLQHHGGVVQSVEQRTHIPYVTGSIPVATMKHKALHCARSFLFYKVNIEHKSDLSLPGQPDNDTFYKHQKWRRK